MGLGELLDRIRERYMAQLAKTAEALAQNPDAEILPETVLRDKDGVAVGEGLLSLPLRTDLARQLAPACRVVPEVVPRAR